MARYLLVSDFDGTIAQTFEPSPNSMAVDKAYDLAVYDLFGKKGMEAYRASGGLRNRNPGEVVASLIERGYSKNIITVEDLVQRKLGYLLAEIGPNWPKPCQGFFQFYQVIECMDSVEFAILSSGHEEFIKKTFSIWGLNPPDIMLTDDDLSGYNPPLPLELASKPSPFLFELIQEEWGGERKHMVMFGDDPEKDGKLAQNAGVPFGLFSRQNHCGFMENSFQFDDWREISAFLRKETSQKLISRGVSASGIIFA